MTYRLETYADIGAMLRDVRENYNISPDDAARAMRLNVKYVIALEEGKLEKLPGIAYARGYIRNYAILLGLDAEELLSQFAAAELHSVSGRFAPAPQEDSFIPHGKLALAAIAVMLAVMVFFGGAHSDEEETRQQVYEIPDDIMSQYQRRQQQISALPQCFSLLLAKRDALCYYRRGIRRAVLQPRQQFSTEVTLRTISGRI